MSINSLMNTALTGLRTSQSAIDTAGNNIANHNVPGYHRQKILRNEESSTKTMPGFIGNGVVAVDVRREYAEFIAQQLRSAQGKNSEINAFYQQISQVDQLLSSKTGNIAGSIQEFFSSFDNVVNNARDIPSRHVVLGRAASMVSRFVTASQFMRQQEEGIKRSINDDVANVNNYTKEIAELNNQIVRLRGSTGSQPNDLMDKRDHLCNELNKIIGVEVLQQGDAYNVSFAGGISLVQGDIAYEVVAMTSSRYPERLTIGYNSGTGSPFEVQQRFIKGSLGGVFRFQTEALDSARNQLGQLALVLAENVNRVNKNGFDLTTTTRGGNFFTIPSAPGVVKNGLNNPASTTTVTAAYNSTLISGTSMAKIMASDYELVFNGTGWTVTRLSDNTIVGTLVPGVLQTIDGLDITVTAGAANGDRFIIKPVSGVAESLTLALTDVSQIAAGLLAAPPPAPATSAGVGDNRNAQNFLNLQNLALIEEKSNLIASYASLVAEVGIQTSVAKIDVAAQSNVAGQLANEQQKLSGVNLDEEYVDIQQLQHAYQANSKVIQAASALFSAILEIVR